MRRTIAVLGLAVVTAATGFAATGFATSAAGARTPTLRVAGPLLPPAS